MNQNALNYDLKILPKCSRIQNSSLMLPNALKMLRGNETRSGYVQYVQGIQPNVPARTVFIDIQSVLEECAQLGGLIPV